MKNSRSSIPAMVLVLTVAMSMVSHASFAAEKGTPGYGKYRNAIVLLMDGTGSAHTTAARWYKGAPLALDRMFLAGIRTYGANSIITDSAPAATAFATGHKSSRGHLGVLPGAVTIPGVPPVTDDLYQKPVATILEGAKLAGKSVGLVATSNVQHASPATYSSHWPDRGMYNEIAEQQVYQDVDVLLGAGRKYLLPASAGGARTDGENLVDVLKSRGVTYVETRDAMVSSSGPRLWGLFADYAMSYEFDRARFTPDEPSLAEMTKKAIELLSRNRKGFFLFVEGSKIDWASHAHDPVGVISDVLAFDEAVRAALDFADREGSTLVLAFADHGNGGMSIGSGKTATYSSLPLSALVDPLRKARLTGEGIGRALGSDLSEANVRAVMARDFGIDDLTAEEVQAIRTAPAGSMNRVVGPMISSRSVIGWTTSGHVGEDLFLYYYGMDKPLGMIENTEIARITAAGLGFDLAEADEELFVRADKAFPEMGAVATIDRTDPHNKALVVVKGAVRAVLPISKDVMTITAMGRSYDFELDGLTVLAPAKNRVYIPKQAVELFRKYSR